jgi:acetolactate synthase-1/2/3 large subunit
MPRGGWTAEELAGHKKAIRAKAALAHPGINPSRLVEAALAAAPRNARITIDAGAHMLPVLHLWKTSEANGSLISRGLSTMGFALPAAVGSAIVDPSRPAIAFTGDGGLMMCLGELGTAVQQGATPIVVVFNDACLSLIGAKQQRRQLSAAGVDFSPANFASIASGFGWKTLRVDEPDALDGAMSQAMAGGAPTLIDVAVDPSGYPDQILALRG